MKMDSTPRTPHRSPRTASPSKLDAKALAATRREGMRRRARRIRRSVIGLALSLFTAAFLAIYVQLASGHDPALTAASNRKSTAATTVVAKKASTTSESSGTSSSASETSTGSESAAEGSESSSSSPTEEAGTSASAVTSSQS